MGIKMGHMMSCWKHVIKNMYKLLYSNINIDVCECVCWAVKYCTVAVPPLIITTIIIIIIQFYKLLNMEDLLLVMQ